MFATCLQLCVKYYTFRSETYSLAAFQWQFHSLPFHSQDQNSERVLPTPMHTYTQCMGCKTTLIIRLAMAPDLRKQFHCFLWTRTCSWKTNVLERDFNFVQVFLLNFFSVLANSNHNYNWRQKWNQMRGCKVLLKWVCFLHVMNDIGRTPVTQITKCKWLYLTEYSVI